MSKVFVNIASSLDGYLAPEGMDMAHFSDPQYKNWGAKWLALMAWVLNQQYLREKLKLGPGGIGEVNEMIRHTFERTGAHDMFLCGNAPEVKAVVTHILKGWLAGKLHLTWEHQSCLSNGDNFAYVNQALMSFLDANIHTLSLGPGSRAV